MMACSVPAVQRYDEYITSAMAVMEVLTLDGELGEAERVARELEVLGAGRGGERRGGADGGLGHRDDIGAVDEVVGVVAEDCELSHRGLERRGHERLLVDEALPEARSALVAGEGEVGLETHLTGVGAAAEGEWRGDLAGVVGGSGEADTLQQDLEEDLGVEGERGLGRQLLVA